MKAANHRRPNGLRRRRSCSCSLPLPSPVDGSLWCLAGAAPRPVATLAGAARISLDAHRTVIRLLYSARVAQGNPLRSCVLPALGDGQRWRKHMCADGDSLPARTPPARFAPPTDAAPALRWRSRPYPWWRSHDATVGAYLLRRARQTCGARSRSSPSRARDLGRTASAMSGERSSSSVDPPQRGVRVLAHRTDRWQGPVPLDTDGG